VTFRTPVALFLFNRPEPLRRVLEVLRIVKPQRLFLVADGPRANHADDERLCIEARSVATGIDWPCEVQTDFSDTNLGCGRRVSSGITWVFEQVDEAIILEDDTLPDPSFFPYCEELLARYRHDERILSVCGWNSLARWPRANADYFFARHGSIWGWATWRRAWQLYDFHLAPWQTADTESILKAWLPDPEHAEVQTWLFNRHAGQVIDTWDIQWTLTCMLNRGLHIMPASNLITNLGFGESHTHTANDEDLHALIPRFPATTPLSPLGGEPTADELFDRWRFLLYQISTYRNVPMLALWEKLLRRNPETPVPGMNEGFPMTLGAIRHPGESLEVLRHLRHHAPGNHRVEPLIEAFERLAEGGSAQ